MATQYRCLAANYLQVIRDEEGESLDATKEEIVASIKNKVFTAEEIKKVSEAMEFDCEKGLIWIDESILEKRKGIEYGIVQRFECFAPDTTEEAQEKINSKLSYMDFYNTVELMNIQQELGFDFIDMCVWNIYNKTTLTFTDNSTVTYYTPTN